jgi:hypothetical protein
MAASDYSPVFPSSTAPEDKIRTFLSEFYRTSDDPTKNDDWVQYFTPDAVLVMGSNTARGTEGMHSPTTATLAYKQTHMNVAEIRKLRGSMWEKVVARKHKPHKVFESGFEGADSGRGEYMLFGEVAYELKTGEKQSMSWAAHAVFAEVEGQLKFKFYRVYIQP